MSRTITLAAVLLASAAVVLAARGVPAQTQTFPRPTADTGPVRVAGAVEVSNTPSVRAAQEGQWTVAVSSIAGLPSPNPTDVVKVGRAYKLAWAGGREVSVRIVEVRSGGWVLTIGTQASDERVWYNLGQVLSIREM